MPTKARIAVVSVILMNFATRLKVQSCYSCYRPFRGFTVVSYKMATTTREQPPWKQPSATDPQAKLPPLKIYNSLTRTKTSFIPIKSKSREVSWYVCGPTVYDDAHLGHARNYVTTDIIRRVLRDYFHFKLKFVMNITDVDDKVRFAMAGEGER